MRCILAAFIQCFLLGVPDIFTTIIIIIIISSSSSHFACTLLSQPSSLYLVASLKIKLVGFWPFFSKKERFLPFELSIFRHFLEVGPTFRAKLEQVSEKKNTASSKEQALSWSTWVETWDIYLHFLSLFGLSFCFWFFRLDSNPTRSPSIVRFQIWNVWT